MIGDLRLKQHRGGRSDRVRASGTGGGGCGLRGEDRERDSCLKFTGENIVKESREITIKRD